MTNLQAAMLGAWLARIKGEDADRVRALQISTLETIIPRLFQVTTAKLSLMRMIVTRKQWSDLTLLASGMTLDVLTEPGRATMTMAKLTLDPLVQEQVQ